MDGSDLRTPAHRPDGSVLTEVRIRRRGADDLDGIQPQLLAVYAEEFHSVARFDEQLGWNAEVPGFAAAVGYGTSAGGLSIRVCVAAGHEPVVRTPRRIGRPAQGGCDARGTVDDDKCVQVGRRNHRHCRVGNSCGGRPPGRTGRSRTVLVDSTGGAARRGPRRGDPARAGCAGGIRSGRAAPAEAGGRSGVPKGAAARSDPPVISGEPRTARAVGAHELPPRRTVRGAPG